MGYAKMGGVLHDGKMRKVQKIMRFYEDLEEKIMQSDQQRAIQQYKNKANNAQGHFFEEYIKAGCILYAEREQAEIDKTPEPFRVLEKSRDGVFKGRFIALAQPDFQGTLAGGRSIVFEAKYTTTDRMQRSVLTGNQQDILERHAQRGALTAVCIGIGDKFFFVPWDVWRDMAQIYGRRYVTAADLEQYRVRFMGAVLFLDYILKKGSEHAEN